MAGSSRNNHRNTLASAFSQPNTNNIPFQWINYVSVAGPAVSYRECQRNHAATIGRYAYDGCGEFLKAGKDGTKEAFLCAACDCHRSFHRKELAEAHNINNVHVVGDHHNVPGVEVISRENMIMAGVSKRKGKTKRTKITEEQKVKMRRFAEKLGWKPQKHDEEEVENFCGEIGITRKMFKVWLSNNRRRPVPETCSTAMITGKENDDDDPAN